MTLADVNVLIHAFRSDSTDHSVCRRWLESITSGDSYYGVSPQVLSGVVRVTTHPRIFSAPSGVAEAVEFCEVLMAQPLCILIEPGARHWSIFSDLCTTANARGNLVTDAWYAALAIESRCEWVTLDRDYARFPGLKWRAPY
jgi:uncharacterized protein